MLNDFILIISNDIVAGEQIVDKIKLVRECDTVKVVSYIEAVSVLNTAQPSVIIVYCPDVQTAGIVKEIRKLKNFDRIPVVFVSDTFDEDILAVAFDNGADDFFFLDDPSAVILMRMFLTVQKSVLYKKMQIDGEIMAASGIVDKDTGIYGKTAVHNIMRNFFSAITADDVENVLYMQIKPVPKKNNKFDLKKAGIEIKKMLRGDDILSFGKNDEFYSLLFDAKNSDAKNIFSRISEKLSENYDIYAVCTDVKYSYENTEAVLSEKIREMIAKGTNFLFVRPEEIVKESDNIVIKDESGKKFKDFQKEFYQNIEKIISPAFAKLQKYIYTAIKDTEAYFNLSETESIFYIKNDDAQTEVIISYPAYVKLIIDIRHNEQNNKPVSKRLIYPFDEISETRLYNILKGIADEFYVKDEEIGL